MKVTIKNNEKVKELKFPKLMECEHIVVFFTKPGVGVYLGGNRSGEYENCFEMDNFRDFKGEITLEQ